MGKTTKVEDAMIDVLNRLRNFSEDDKRTILNCVATLLNIEAYEFDKRFRAIEQLWECFGDVKDRLNTIEDKIGLGD